MKNLLVNYIRNLFQGRICHSKTYLRDLQMFQHRL
jgi:hypothetical protein